MTNKGFTLIEIMIAISIMAGLTILTAQSIQSALRTSKKYRRQIDEAAEIRDVLRIIEKDINLAFHYRDVHSEMLEAIEKENKKSNKNTGANTQQNSEGKKEVPNYTEFKGDGNSIHFTSLNNVRTVLDSKESDQAEIGYFLKTCNSRGNNKKTSTCLWRRLSPILDDKVDEGGRSIVLIENVKQFSLRYMGESSEEAAEPEWVVSWLSGKDGDETTKDKFPVAVEINLSINRQLGNKTVTQKMSSIAAVRFPNNKKKKDESQQDETPQDGDQSENK